MIPIPAASRAAKYMMFFWCAVFLMLSAAASAQIRLYDPANDELARKTRDAFTEFSKGDANVFDTMISNTLAMKEATLAQLFEMNRQARKDKFNIIPIMTWERLLKEVEKTQKDFLTAYNAARLILDSGSQDAQTIKEALEAAKEKLNALQKEKTAKEAELKREDLKLADLKDHLQKLRDAVAASTKPITNLSDLAEFKNLETAWAQIQSLKDWFDIAKKAANAPGLQLTILDLGVQHQQIAVDRLNLQVEAADAALKIRQRINQRLALVWGDGTIDLQTGHLTAGLFGQIYEYVVPCPQGGNCAGHFLTDQTQSEQVLETVGKLSVAAKGEVGTPLRATLQLRNLLDVLGRYATLIGYQKYLLLADTVESAVDTHLFSIHLSALNTKDREMLVSHGLDGLAAYHAGGLKPEEIANFFRAVQTIAISVLAGRVQ
jgi:hypothetical protein